MARRGSAPQSGILGQYRVLGPIAGRVYRAEHRRIGRVVAIKLLGDPSSRSRPELVRQGQRVSQIIHDNVVAITDMVEHRRGELFMVMELVPGCDLAALLRREGPLPLCRALPIALQICRGLAAVHEAGVVHGNLDAEHLCVARGRIKLVGFGAAIPDRSATPAADVFALGQVLQALFASRRGVPEALERLIRGCSAPDLDRRPEVASLVERLEQVTLVPAPVERREPVRPVDVPRRRGRVWAVLAALVGLIAAFLVPLATEPSSGASPAQNMQENASPRIPTARIVLRSDPPGASVYREGDLAVSLGRTPLELQLPNLGDLVQFVFHKDGYENASAAVVVRDETHVGVEMESAHVDR